MSSVGAIVLPLSNLTWFAICKDAVTKQSKTPLNIWESEKTLKPLAQWSFFKDALAICQTVF